MPGSLAHLTRRFFDYGGSRPLDAAERAMVETWAGPGLGDLFFSQNHADQRHGFESAVNVIARGLESGDVVVAALMHDVGKRHARLGIIGRVVASLLILLRLPLTARMTAYRDHGLAGAADLAEAGAPALAVEFALHHHGPRPAGFDEATWDALVEADEPAKVEGSLRRRIIS